MLEVDASGSRFMLSSVHPCCGEPWSFPDELFVIGYLVVSCSFVLNDQIFYSNYKLFPYNLNFVECYYFVNIYFHTVYLILKLSWVEVFILSWIQLSIIIIVQISRKIIVIVVSLLWKILIVISVIAISILPRSCIGFLGNRSGGSRTGHRARPQVADRAALYRGLLLNTDTKLNKQSRTMFQGWSRRNNPQAKVLTTVPRAAWYKKWRR